MKFILGKKLQMSQTFDEEKGKVVPVTLIEAGPCEVIQVKNKKRDGYYAYQLGFGQKKKVNKTLKGHFKKLGPFGFLREARAKRLAIRVEDKIAQRVVSPGDKIDVSVFVEGEKVSVSGISKGKGFAGAVKRWGFKERGAAHGVKHEMRTLGSTGSRFPQRVIKGRKMPGRMGHERVTVKNLEVVKVDKENNLLALKGAVPGARGTLLEIRG